MTDEADTPTDPDLGSGQGHDEEAGRKERTPPSAPASQGSGAPTDALVERAKQGDLHAFNRLFVRYYPRVRSVVRKRLGESLRRHLESVDIVNEAFLQAKKGFDKFEMRGKSSLINYLCKLAERKILEAIRKYPSGGVSLGEEPEGRLDAPSESASHDEQVGAMRQCIEQLKPARRECIMLRYFFHLTWDQITEVTDRPSPDAARMVRDEALKDLRRCMRNRGYSSIDLPV